MNIILASAELTPFAKAGGLADITASLSIEWKKYEQNPIIILPKYSFIDVEGYGFKPTDIVLFVKISTWTEFARLWYGILPNSCVPVYLIENNDYFQRAGIYGEPNEYFDNDRRFIFFSRAIFEVANALSFTPDVIHSHDFHTAMTMAFLKSQYRYSPLFSRCAGVYTIHNLAHQGWFEPHRAMTFSSFGMEQFYPGSWFEHRNWFNAMKAGIMFADKITTVSPTYSYEIRSPYYSEGMQDILNQRAGDLIGILNGVYYEEWSPETDKYIFTNYSSNNLELKRVNKIHFLKEWGLNDKDNLDLPLVGIVSRLAEQKGIDLLIYKLEEYLANNTFRFVLLGSGEKHYEDHFRYLSRKYPDKALINIGYNNAMAHKIICSSDFILLPSRFEPCGLTQMYALKYGTIPIVRNTGGLADTVKEYIPEKGSGDGIVFLHYYNEDFAFAIRRALSLFNLDPHWDIIRRNAMAEDFSSARTALEYLKVFKWAIEKVRG